MGGRLRTFAAVAVLASLCVPGTGAASAAARIPAGPRAAALAALERLLSDSPGTDQAAPWHRPAPRSPTQSASNNWSGYADSGSTFTQAQGTWSQPGVKCTSAVSVAVFWTGLDGFTSNTVEQDGSLAFCSGHKASYFTWWEMFPSNSIQLVGSTVLPGDTIKASVAANGATYTLKVSDTTTPGNSFTQTQVCTMDCLDADAEWIAEAPTSNNTILPLARFGTWTLKSASVSAGTTSGTISSFADYQIFMIDANEALEAAPGPLNTKGNQFRDIWKAST